MEDPSLSSGAVVSRDLATTGDFFVTHCGSNDKAIEFLESVVEHIGGSKKRISNFEAYPEISKIMKTAIGPSPSPHGESDEISDLYINDATDNETVTLVILAPNDIGLSSHMIGKQGSNVADIRKKTNCRVQLEQIQVNAADRNVFFYGKVKDLPLAYQLMQRRMVEKAEGGLSYISDVTKMVVPNELVARIIGKSGTVIKKLQAESGARTQIQTEDEMLQLNSAYYGRNILITGILRQRCHAVYLLLRQMVLDRDLPMAWKGNTPHTSTNPGRMSQQQQQQHQPMGMSMMVMPPINLYQPQQQSLPVPMQMMPPGGGLSQQQHSHSIGQNSQSSVPMSVSVSPAQPYPSPTQQQYVHQQHQQVPQATQQTQPSQQTAPWMNISLAGGQPGAQQQAQYAQTPMLGYPSHQTYGPSGGQPRTG